jgi:isoleucyl-tRNA synthetase
MSSLYFDALKDPLYSRGRNDARRRSAQSALLHVLGRLLTSLAPVLSFTTEEAWQALPEVLRGGHDSIFDTTLYSSDRDVADEITLWETLRDLRSQVAASEGPRDFEARARLTVSPDLYKYLAGLGDNLREALVVSQLELVEATEDGIVELTVSPAQGEKCARCWKFRELGTDPKHPTICADCAAVVNALPSS